MFVDNYWKQFLPIEMYWHYINLCILLIIGIFSLIANSFVLIYLIDYRKFRRPGTYFLMNIVLIDILKATFNLPMNIVSSIYGEWVFGQIGCDLYGFSGGILGFARISTMVIIAIERYYIIKNPFSSLNQSKKKIKILIIIVWVYSGFWMCPAFLTKNGFTLEGFLTHCSFDYLSRDSSSRCFMMLLFIGGFLVPLALIIIFCYLFFHKLSSNEVFESMIITAESTPTEIFKTSFTRESTKTSDPKSPKSEERLVFIYRSHTDLYMPDYEKRLLIIQNEIKTIKVLCFMVSMFFIAWLPYALLVLYAQFGSNIQYFVTPYTTNLPGLFAKTSSIYYPIIFIASDQRCRKHLMKKFKII